VFGDPDEFQSDVTQYLHADGVHVSSPLTVTISLVEAATLGGRPFTIHFSKRNSADEAKAPDFELVIMNGEKAGTMFRSNASRINLGRLNEVLDKNRRLARRNELSFTESDPIYSTVSRVHAHLAYDARANVFRIYDDRSRFGTTVARSGKTISVTAGGRGVTLASGDEVHLGRACVRFILGEASHQG
jgi:hypothetical protein